MKQYLKRDYEEWQRNPHYYVATTPYVGCATCGYGPGAYFHNEYRVQQVAKAKLPTFDPRDSAAVLFRAFPKQVTRDMIKKVRVIFYVLPMPEDLYELLIHEERSPEEPPTAALEYWPDCPNCKQSATGRYWHGIHGCTRCGWSAGGNKSKRSAL